MRRTVQSSSRSQTATRQPAQSSLEDQRVEVLLETHEGAERVTLRYSTWTDGLGWCSQKTIRLDTDQLDNVHRALTVARHRINRHRAESGLHKERAEVIKLPALA